MTKSMKRFVIVTGDTTEEFQVRLNEVADRLQDKEPEFVFNGELTRAKVEYTETFEEDEPTAAEIGITFKCVDCPHFEPELNRDGTVDLRKKFGGCKFALMNRTFKDSAACEVLYNEIKNGEVGLCIR